MTNSELNKIQQDKKKATVVEQNSETESEESEDEVIGAIRPSEYDYLLSMPLWSLSEEKVEELNRQMNNKKDDHDNLEKTHIHALWERDLDTFLDALALQEEIDERDRCSHKGVKNNGKKRAAVPKKAAQSRKPV